MIKVGEDELICDLAETYGVFNYRELSPAFVATLAIGLRDNSRIKMKISDTKINLEQSLMALMIDNLQFLCWTKTKDGSRNRNKPDSLYKKLAGLDKKKKDELLSFKTPEEYEAHMMKIRGF